MASQISSLVGGDSDDATLDSDGKIIVKRMFHLKSIVQVQRTAHFVNGTARFKRC
jgi:hypothetical protein